VPGPHVNLVDLLSIELGGTKLIRRTEPPRDNKPTYAEDEKGEFLGTVVLVPGVPRWMSPHFAEVAGEQHLPEAAFDQYSQDWMEKIVYVPKDDKLELTKFDVMVKFARAANHQLCVGCQQLSPRTRIEGVGAGGALLDPTLYFAIVSKVASSDEVVAEEITITDISNRHKFVPSPIHAECLLRVGRLLGRNRGTVAHLQSERRRAMDAVRGLVPPPPSAFEP
jgi:hypothetical protein